MKLPNGFKIGKRKSNGIMLAGLPVYAGVAQIFLECTGNKKGCHDTISLIPLRDSNELVDSISDKEASKIFFAHGWDIVGFRNKKHTRCPICKTNK